MFVPARRMDATSNWRWERCSEWNANAPLRAPALVIFPIGITYMLSGRLHSRRNPTYGVVRILDVAGLVSPLRRIQNKK